MSKTRDMTRWKPSRTARREFARRMEDPAEKAAYDQRKADRAERRRSGSKFDYDKAGGNYVPTREQYVYAVVNRRDMTDQQKQAADMVIFGYITNDKVHHDHIHIINELRRSACSDQ